MGYTHYFSGLCCTEKLANFTKKAIELSDVSICGGLGVGEPVITAEKICFNGDKSKHENYETFWIMDHVPEDEEVNFCKVSDMPYDEVVTAVLLAAIKLKTPGSENIRSDGKIIDWSEGIKLFVKTWKALYDINPIDIDFADKVARQLKDTPEMLLIFGEPDKKVESKNTLLDPAQRLQDNLFADDSVAKEIQNLADKTQVDVAKEMLCDESGWMIHSGDVDQEYAENYNFQDAPDLSKKELQEIAENADALFRQDQYVMQTFCNAMDDAIMDHLRKHYPSFMLNHDHD